MAGNAFISAGLRNLEDWGGGTSSNELKEIFTSSRIRTRDLWDGATPNKRAGEGTINWSRILACLNSCPFLEGSGPRPMCSTSHCHRLIRCDHMREYYLGSANQPQQQMKPALVHT